MAEAGYPDGFEIQNIIVSNPAPYTEVVGPAIPSAVEGNA